MNPPELKYNIEHTWLRMEGGNVGRVGITQFAQEQLKTVVFVDLPEAGAKVTHMEPFGVIESIKATNDLYSPVTGEVVGVNSAVKDDPGLVNQSPYEGGWMITVRLSDMKELDKLVSAAQYEAALAKKP
jgi:glycine cleavage system H protein